MLDTLYAVWDLDCDDPDIIGLFETKDEPMNRHHAVSWKEKNNEQPGIH